MEPRVSYDLNELLNPMLGLAERMLAAEGEFHPFGARLAAGGQVAVIDVAPSIAEPNNPLIMDALYATFRLEARAGTIRACGVCWEALVPSEDGHGLTEAIAIGLEHRVAIRRSSSAPTTATLRGGCGSTSRPRA